MFKKYFLLFLLSIGQFLYSDDEESLNLVKKYVAEQSYTKALESLNLEELSTNIKAQNMLGVMYQLGLGMKQDLVKARHQYEKGALVGDLDAQFFLGALHYEMQNLDEAILWLERLDRNEYKPAPCLLGKIFLTYAEQDPPKYKDALKWFEKAAFQGDTVAQHLLATMYLCGKGVRKNYFKALSWYELASKQHFAPSTYQLGAMYMNGEGVHQDFKKAAELFEEAANGGHSTAQCNLGIFYNRGIGVQKNIDKSLYWLNLAALQNEEQAIQEMKDMAATGKESKNMSVIQSNDDITEGKADVKQGDVVYTYGTGKIQCESQIDPSGQIVILLKNLNNNTKIKFRELKKNKKRLVLVGVMEVKEETDLCASWTNLQEVNLAIDPLPVQIISLKGTPVYSEGKISVCM